MTDAALLAALPGWGFALLLVLARAGTALMLLPGVGEAEVPAMPRAGLALAVAVLLLPSVAERMPGVPDAPLRAAAMVVAELACGLWLGWLARLPMLALPVAGQVISYLLGLSSVLVPDATLGGQGTAVSRLFALAAPVLILVSGLYAFPLAALGASYALVPPGALVPAADGAAAVLAAVGSSFALSLRLAAPFVLASVVWQVAAGLLARAVPRMQVYFVAVPGQILGGLALLGLLGGALLGAWRGGVADAYALLPPLVAAR